MERGIIVRQGVVPLRRALPDILSSNTGAISPRIVNLIGELVQDWRRLDERIAAVSAEIESDGRTVCPAQPRDWVPKWPFEVLPLVSLGCARIPMMARSKLLHLRGLIH
jgi:hypothetical protein